MKMKPIGALVTLAVLAGVALTAVDAVDAARKREAPPGYVPPARAQTEAKVGGADCANATAVASLPFVDTDNTCGAPQVVEDYFSPNCNTLLYPGPELIYEIELAATNEVQIVLTPTAPADMGMFLVSDCATPFNACVGFLDIAGGGNPAIIAPGQTVDTAGGEATFAAVGAATYHIYVDSYYGVGAESCGAYTLEVTGSGLPVELIDFRVD